MTDDRKILIGIDPGLATGLCVIDITDMSNPVSLEDCILTVDEFFGKMDELVKKYMDISIVCEDFHITTETAKKTPQPYSLWLIGVCKYFSWSHGIPLTLQSPSQKPFATDDRLRAVGWWVKNSAGHSNDSYRHVMVWILERNRRWASKLILPDKENDD